MLNRKQIRLTLTLWMLLTTTLITGCAAKKVYKAPIPVKPSISIELSEDKKHAVISIEDLKVLMLYILELERAVQ